MAFLSLKNLIPAAVSRAGIGKHVAATSAIDTASGVFKELFGSGVQKMITPTAVKGSQLVVQVTSGVLAQEVRLREKLIIEKLQKHHPNITQLRVLS